MAFVIPPPSYSEVDLEVARLVAISRFRRERLEEPLEDYLEHFDYYQSTVEDLLEATVDLTQLESAALAVFSDNDLLEAFRYLAGPPISKDDLKVVSEAPSLNTNRLRKDPELLSRLVEVVRIAMDRRRFPWLSEEREPTESERQAAVLASAALIATQRTQTSRRSVGKGRQEERVEEALLAGGLKKVATRTVTVLAQAPDAGHFCRESYLGTRKADFLVGLRDGRVLAVECKVSNSATNSVKRLNNDAAAKAEVWRRDFGQAQVVPAAVLSGVYNLRNLLDAQDRGLALFWEHDIESLVNWVNFSR